MNICYVCNEYPEGPHGGVGTMTQLLAEELSTRKHNVKVIGVYNLNYPSPDFEINKGVEITRIKVDFKNRFAVLAGNWKMARNIRSWIKDGQIDIIEASDSYGLFSLFANFKKPLILRANGNNTYFQSILNTPLKKNTAFYESNLYKKAFGYCAVSEFTAKRMKELYEIPEPITVIYNAVEAQQDQLLDEPGRIENGLKVAALSNPIVFSGSLTPKKGIFELVYAVINLLNKGLDVNLIINGKDSMNINTGQSVKIELQNLIPESLLSHFIFNGHVSRRELMVQYKNSKAAIFPSFAEAFAFAPMEAMASGIPTIFSEDCSGKELIIDKVDGFLISPSSVESISQAIEFVLQNPIQAALIAQKGKEKISEQFSKETMTTKSLEFYEQIILKYNQNQ